jgi:hypothetical protein
LIAEDGRRWVSRFKPNFEICKLKEKDFESQSQ